MIHVKMRSDSTIPISMTSSPSLAIKLEKNASGGTIVIPNPESEPTEDLETVKINADTFRIHDPELSDWARQEEKPTYNPDEVNAVNRDNPITTETINRFVNAVFGI